MTGRRKLRWHLLGLLWMQGAVALALLGLAIYQSQAMRTYDRVAEVRTARATCMVLGSVAAELSGEETHTVFADKGTHCRVQLASGRTLVWSWDTAWWHRQPDAL